MRLPPVPHQYELKDPLRREHTVLFLSPATALLPNTVMSATGVAAPAISISSLDAVVSIPEHAEKWPRLDDNKPLAQLHTKFWGTSMAEEEEAWRAKQQPTFRLNESKDDDIGPGCYVLDINNKAIGIQRLWVRVSTFTPE